MRQILSLATIGCQTLESRTLMAIDVSSPVTSFVAHTQTPATDTVDLAQHFSDTEAPETVARLQTSGGEIDIALTDTATPQTVTNFVNYITSGRYDNNLFSRSVPGFVEQLGGYSTSNLSQHIHTDAAIPSEFANSAPDATPQQQVLALFAADPTVTNADGTTGSLGGTYTLTYAGSTTPPIAANTPATAAAGSPSVQSILNDLFSSIGNGLVAAVDGQANNAGVALNITLSGGTDFQLLQIDPSGLTGAAATPASVTVAKNVRGTVAMALSAATATLAAKDTATSEWFANLADNANNLDLQNGGFTTFGKVIKGMDIFDQIAQLPTADLSKLVNNGALTDVPLQGWKKGQQVQFRNLVVVNSATAVPGAQTITFTATSTNANLVRPIVSGHTLSFEYANGASGSSVITITGTGVTGTTNTETFTVTVPNAATPDAGPVANDDAPAPIITNAGLVAIHPLDNDTDSKASLVPSTLTFVKQPDHGTVSLDPGSGSVIFQPAAGFTGTDTFQYTVSDDASPSNVSNVATVTLTVSAPAATVALNSGGNRMLQFTDPDGTPVRVVVGGLGQTTVTFAGPNVVLTPFAGVVTATGPDATLADISITDFRHIPSTLVITTSSGGDNSTTLGSFHGTGVIAAIIAPNVNFTGTLNASGLGRLVLGAATNATLDIGPAVTTALVSINTVTNTNLTGTNLLNVRANRFVSTTGFEYTVNAASIGTLLVNQDFGNSIKLTGSTTGPFDLRIARIGQLTGGTWTIPGQVGTVLTNGAPANWTFTGNNLVQAFRFNGDFAGNIDTGAIGTMIVTGSMNNASVVSGAPLSGRFVDIRVISVGGGINNSIIRTSGIMGVVIAKSLVGSDILAGMSSSLGSSHTLPTALSDFVSNSTITLVRVNSFSDSRIAAANTGQLLLGTITAVEPAGSVEGVAAHLANFISGAFDNGGALVLTRPQMKSTDAIKTLLTTRGIDPHDCQIDIITA